MLAEKIREDLKESLKKQDAARVGVLRFALAALQSREKDKQAKGQSSQLTDDEVVDTLSREIKKRKDSVELFTKGNRPDLAQKEQAEIEIISAYLPTPLTDDEVDALIRAAQENKGFSDFPSIMKEVVSQARGRVDGKKLSERVKQTLAK